MSIFCCNFASKIESKYKMEQVNHNEAENYLYERAERRYQEMKAGRFLTNEDSMTFIKEYATQNQRVAV